jgi:hypothetical protein
MSKTAEVVVPLSVATASGVLAVLLFAHAPTTTAMAHPQALLADDLAVPDGGDTAQVLPPRLILRHADSATRISSRSAATACVGYAHQPSFHRKLPPRADRDSSPQH